MDKSTKALIAGLVAAGSIVTTVFLRHNYLEQKLEELERDCRRESEEIRAKATNLPEGWKNLGLVCDPGELNDTTATGIQGQIAKVKYQRRTDDWPVQLALLIATVSAVPWVWYFLLRRIRELRDAVAGK